MADDTSTGPDSGTGEKHAWPGNRRAGRGSMEIVRADSPGRVEIDLVFEKPFKARNDTVFSLCKMDKLLGNDFEKGLAGLNSVAETQVASPA